MAAKRPRTTRTEAGKAKRRPARPFRPTWPDNAGLVVHKSKQVKNAEFARRVVAFQQTIDREERDNEWKRNEDARFLQDRRSAKASRTGGRNSGTRRADQASKLDAELIADAIDVVTTRPQPCGSSCEQPCARHRNGWSRYALAAALWDRYEDENDSGRFTSADAIDKRLAKYWTRTDRRLLLRNPGHHLRAATRIEVGERLVRGTLHL